MDYRYDQVHFTHKTKQVVITGHFLGPLKVPQKSPDCNNNQIFNNSFLSLVQSLAHGRHTDEVALDCDGALLQDLIGRAGLVEHDHPVDDLIDRFALDVGVDDVDTVDLVVESHANLIPSHHDGDGAQEKLLLDGPAGVNLGPAVILGGREGGGVDFEGGGGGGGGRGGGRGRFASSDLRPTGGFGEFRRIVRDGLGFDCKKGFGLVRWGVEGVVKRFGIHILSFT